MSIHPGLLGKYELRERLGQGGMAEVWKAYDQRLQRFVAIKFLHTMLQADPAFLSRFVREAQAVASLRHPNIVQVYDFETSMPGAHQAQPLAYMVMDYIEGQTLADYLSQTIHAGQFLAPADLVSLFLSISSAVDYAHQRGLLHRDIKPANILLDQRHTERNPMGEPILTDFGIVKIQGSAAGTLTSSAMGTPLYIAPEQALGRELDAASDLYSLGVVLYEACAGTLPFTGSSPVALLQQHIAEPPPAPSRANPAISPALDAVILRALAKKPAERYPSALAMTAALAEALDVPLPALPARPNQSISAPDIRELPTSAPTLLAEATLAPGQVSISDVPTAPSEQPHLPTLLAGVPSELAETPREVGPAAAGTLSMRVPSAPTRSWRADTPPPLPPQIPHRSARRRGLLLISLFCVLLILLGSAVTVFLRLHSQSASNGATSQMIGSAFFTSSGDGSGANNLGLNDIFQARLTNVSAPAPGTQYYAWLLPDQSQTEASARALGTLTISGGTATLATPYMDPQHANLIALFSRFLVTQEPTHPTPLSPSLNTALWRYYALIPQTSIVSNCQGATNTLSVLCHLRHLLSGDPELARVNLQGGLNYWFLNNVKELQKWATEAVDHNSAVDVRHKIADILYLLDGNACGAQDLLHGAAGADNVTDDATITALAAVPLMDCAQTPNNPGYLSHIHNHLNAVIQSPGFQKDQTALATQIGSELNTVNAWLQELQSDARQLLAMDDTQLIQPAGRAMRSQLDTLATNVLSGGTDPTTGALDKGAASISDQIQQLAAMDIMLFASH